MTRRLIPLCLMLALTGVATGLAQPQAPLPPPTGAPSQPPVTFRAEVNYVEVDARVLDDKGAFVSDLKATDFEILEDGTPQQVSAFSLVNIPVERAPHPLFASKPIESDVNTNLAGNEGRIYLIVLDDLHTNVQRSGRVKQAARTFIDRYIGANDIAAVVHTGGRTDAGQDFTSNQRLLLASVERFMGRKVRSSTLERVDEELRTREQRGSGDRVDDPSDRERGFQARNALDTVKNLAEYLGGIRGRRKAMVLFSEGIDYNINDVFNNQDATIIMDATRNLIAAATRANVNIYGVDPRGLSGMAEEGIEVAAFPDDRSLGIGQSSFNNEVRQAQDSLRVLSDETGGFAVVNNNDFASAFQRIVDDNSAYYVMGYYPTNDKRDGRVRKIEVKVAGRPGLTVRSRKGYVAPKGRAAEAKPAGPNGASTELREAMASPLPLAALPMSITAAVFKGPKPNGSVVISTFISGAALPFVEKDGTFNNTLEVAIVAVDSKGKSFSGDRHTLTLNMKPDTLQRVKALGFRAINQLDLPPGRYQLRVGVREGNDKRAGSVSYDLEVPDFSKEKLGISSLAITSAASALAPTARSKDPLQKLLPGPLSAFREFPQGDELALFTEIYDNTGNQPHKVDIGATLKAEGGQTVFQTREERDSTELAGKSGGYGFTTRVPLKDVAPGLYVLRVAALSRLGNQPEVAREVVIQVVASPRP